MSGNSLKTAVSITLVTLCLSGVVGSAKGLASDINIKGLLMDKTITWFGHDFFFYFAREWRNKPFSGRHTLVIEEKPSARNGTQVEIRYKGQLVFKTAISNMRSLTRELGAQAVSLVLQRLQDIEFQASNNQFADLRGEEI